MSPRNTELVVEVISLSNSCLVSSPLGSVKGANLKNVIATVFSDEAIGISPAPIISVNSSPANCSLIKRSYRLSLFRESMT